MKLGLIRCFNKENQCGTINCLETIKERKSELENVVKVKLVGITTCGGCSGKKIGLRAKQMLQDGADKIALSSCIVNTESSDFNCPYTAAIKDSLAQVVGEEQIIYL
ncbi:putative metal-binding protein [Halobacteroides halobius DSM 5150]|uniref:Putative metal-binding protein n=1 Tax=Halobacteroides halobius (strain ATCC 35273 / DSM 5150 / MD-1) TaxID=748449 RepID=L0K758_HALHC|nr:CGGC domain-containing protein [Halobacteroides halobius]AGB41122.1 putative metal-binding protein [Halobacteroides halobius DSM 5150]